MMIIKVKMRRRGFVMLVLFCLNCGDEKCCHCCRSRVYWYCNERDRERHRQTHPQREPQQQQEVE